MIAKLVIATLVVIVTVAVFAIVKTRPDRWKAVVSYYEAGGFVERDDYVVPASVKRRGKNRVANAILLRASSREEALLLAEAGNRLGNAAQAATALAAFQAALEVVWKQSTYLEEYFQMSEEIDRLYRKLREEPIFILELKKLQDSADLKIRREREALADNSRQRAEGYWTRFGR